MIITWACPGLMRSSNGLDWCAASDPGRFSAVVVMILQATCKQRDANLVPSNPFRSVCYKNTVSLRVQLRYSFRLSWARLSALHLQSREVLSTSSQLHEWLQVGGCRLAAA